MPMPGVSAELFPHIAECIGVPLPHIWDLSAHEDEVGSTLTINQILALSSFTGISIEALIGLDPQVRTDTTKIGPDEFCASIRSCIDDSGLSIAEFGEKSGWEIERFINDPSQFYDLANWDCLRGVKQAIGVDPIRVLPRGNSQSESGRREILTPAPHTTGHTDP